VHSRTAKLHKIQAGYNITLLSQNYAPPTVTIDPAVDMKTPPKVQVDTMPAKKYFAYAAELLKVIPPHITDQPIIAQLKKIGIEPGKSFDLDNAAPAVRKALENAPGHATAVDDLGSTHDCPRSELLVNEHQHHAQQPWLAFPGGLKIWQQHCRCCQQAIAFPQPSGANDPGHQPASTA
jgi:hypothetical protein